MNRQDQHLIQIVDAATADATRRSGHWLHCRLGCTQCCMGIFSITQLDAARLREGLATLDAEAPERADAVRRRAAESVRCLTPDFPGNAVTGQLNESDPRFDDFANDEPCPALNPTTGACDLYAARPITCRTFGPPVRTEGGIGICELNFVGASAEEIVAAELDTTWSEVESLLNSEAEIQSDNRGPTTVPWALLQH